MAATVQSGIYYGFSHAELLTELERYKAEVKKLSSKRLSGATVNGQSYSFGPAGDLSLHQWQAEIQSALAQVDPEGHPYPSRIAKAVF